MPLATFEIMSLLLTVLVFAALHGTNALAADYDTDPGQQGSSLDQLTARLAGLEVQVQKLGDLEQRVQHLEHVVRVQSTRIQSQSREMKLLRNFIKRTTNTPSDDNGSLANLEMAKYPKDKETDEEDTRTSPKPNTIAADLNSGENAGLNRGIRAAAGVAFSVYLTRDPGHLGEHQVVKYDTVRFNDGNGYSKYTGVFTCPVDGVYLFLYNVGHQGSGQIWIELMVNGQKMNAVTVETFHDNEENQGGNSVIVRLSAGEAVWVEVFWTSGHDNNIDGHHFLTTFSGVRIY